jgi:predicted metal-dependent hydrolase
MTNPIIALAGMDADNLPAWLDEFTARLDGQYQFKHYDDRSNYVSWLVDHLVALVIAAGEDWRFWTATPKSSPATRRIPIFLITEDEHAQESGLKSGADLVLSPDELLQDGQRLIRDFARVPEPARIEQLDCECQDKLPPLAVEGVRQFNAGEFYKQHDLFEELWMETDGPVRDLYRAILQVGVAYYQILRGNHRGARKMLLRSVQWLATLPDECQGIDVKALREDSYRVRAALEQLPEEDIQHFDRALLQPVKMTACSERK